ncbi:MAG: hypothetical protein IJW23_08145 [Lentisphaeria bacterium]|nr:hypothetical protein [Lentisphaeria bacterium]
MLKNFFCCTLLIMILFILPGCRDVQYKVMMPESSQMKYLLFPAASYKNNLNRAIIVSGEELYFKEKIAYYVQDTEVLSDKENFTLYSDEQYINLINQLNIEIGKWGKNTDLRRIEYFKENDFMLLTLVFKSGRKSFFRYKVSDKHKVSSAESGIEMLR